jgi:hypothetical protein
MNLTQLKSYSIQRKILFYQTLKLLSQSSEANQKHQASKQNGIYQPWANSLNQSADPCDDFYSFTCGKFIANNPIVYEFDHVSTLTKSESVINRIIKGKFLQQLNFIGFRL